MPHNEGSDKLANAEAQKSVLHKESPRCRSVKGQQRGSRRKMVRGRGVKRQVAVQVIDSSSEDIVQIDKNRRKCQWQGPT